MDSNILIYLPAGVPFLRNFVSRRAEGVSGELGEWDFSVEVAVLLNESDRAELDRVELDWILDGTHEKPLRWLVRCTNLGSYLCES